MEQTLGKRIVRHRKAMGMTQDQLAERLGVTAQAVSKWENDQSCPDITTLPKLAEIFSTSTDALLGIAEEPLVREATVVREPASDESVHIRNGNWEFKYEHSRRGGILFAGFFLLVGVLYLVNSLLHLDVGLWDIIWPSALLLTGINGLFPKFSFLSLGAVLFGGFFLVNSFVPMDLQLDSGVIVAVVILLIGGSLLLEALRKPKRPMFQFNYQSKDESSNTRCSYEVSEDGFEFNGSFGDLYQNVELPVLDHGEINTSFGDFTVDLSGVNDVTDDCHIEANVSFGNVRLQVPKKYRVVASSNASFASVEIKGNHDPNPVGVINLEANVSFGQISVQYI